MGVRKQRWTPAEEAALKAGVQRYGAGKWSAILKDPEFNVVLRARSNVDLKDKWRNLHCMANGLGSRSRSSVAQKNIQLPPRHEGARTCSVVVEEDSIVPDAMPLRPPYSPMHDSSSRAQISRMNDLILEGIEKLNEPRGSSRHAIAEYIEEHHWESPDIDKTLAASLKFLTEKGKLIKEKRYYRIAPRSISLEEGKIPSSLPANAGKKDLPEAETKSENPSSLPANAGKKDVPEADTKPESPSSLPAAETKPIVILTKAQIDAELEKMKSMSAAEAAAAAAQAVAEAEAAIAAAEAAAREAEEAEKEAEAAYSVVDATQKSRNSYPIRVW